MEAMACRNPPDMTNGQDDSNLHGHGSESAVELLLSLVLRTIVP